MPGELGAGFLLQPLSSEEEPESKLINKTNKRKKNKATAWSAENTAPNGAEG